MKAIRTELLALEVITARFLPLKPPNRMLHYYMQFSSLMYCLSIGQSIMFHSDSCRTLNLSGAKVSIREIVNDSFHCHAPFFFNFFQCGALCLDEILFIANQGPDCQMLLSHQILPRTPTYLFFSGQVLQVTESLLNMTGF